MMSNAPFNPSQIQVSARNPYPPIAAENPNRRLVIPLSYDLASRQSEMTAIYTYTYDSFVLKAKYPELSELVLRIAEVEMHHLQILGQLITLLGGDPRCASIGNGSYFPWNGTAVSYQRNLKTMLLQNKKAEQNAANTYLNQSKRIKDAKISAVLARMAEDEQLHSQIFQECYTHYFPS